MQYICQHRLCETPNMTTNDGKRIRIIDPGILNTDAGPDFFNAKIEIDSNLWVGNVEIHVRASDWKRHNHNTDRAYDNVILHVVDKDDAPTYRTNGELIPQMVMHCSSEFNNYYSHLVNSSTYLPCGEQIKEIPSLYITEMIEGLAFERLHSKTLRINSLLETFAGSWEDVCYVTLARNLGFGINNDAFERLARSMPLRFLHKHADSLFQIEALLFRQAGMLNIANHTDDLYYQQLCKEYTFLTNKFQLHSLNDDSWKSFRISPQNFPHRRIAILAHFIYGGFQLMQRIIEAKNDKEIRAIFDIQLTGYWANHYSFGTHSEVSHKSMSRQSLDIILINTVPVLLTAYGEHFGN